MTHADIKSKNLELDARWIKASVAGSMWAASEIVIGSFLHNLRVPFSGSILTAIGVILLISISYKWNEKGLFWRAGLICAIMKTLSPSAVIFGPMIAILSEALMMELSVRILGRTAAGYITGAVLAMSWSLVQRVLTLIVFYGTSIIDVYTELADMAQKQTGIQADMVWLPLLILLSADILMGVITAITGLRLGRRIASEADVNITPDQNYKIKNRFNDPDQKTRYSIVWLFVNLVLFLASMLVLNYSSWLIWLIAIPMTISVWITRYRRAMRQLMNPKFWVFFIIITLLTSFVFTKSGEGEDVLREGLREGLRMNFRAAIIIIGFSALGTELYNPLIRNFFTRTSFRNIPLALELATESLPLFIASIPGFKTIIKTPVPALSGVVHHASHRLIELQHKNRTNKKVLIISGAMGEGKTTFAGKLAENLMSKDIEVRGILTERIIENGKTTGYDILDISSKEKEKFLRITSDKKLEKIGRYSIFVQGLHKGKEALSPGQFRGVMVIDEIGRLELENKGWAGCLSTLLDMASARLVITVRDSFVDEVIKKWNLENRYVVYKIKETDISNVVRTISDHCNFS